MSFFEKFHYLRCLRFFVALVCVQISSAANAVTQISEAEWLAWPLFCKAAYLGSDYGGRSSFVGRVPIAQLDSILSSFGTTYGVPGAHHFCVGLIYVNRAKTRVSDPKRAETIQNAITEIKYSHGQMNPAAPKYSLVAAYYGTALHLAGKRQQAFDMWKSGIEEKPGSRESYLAMAQALLSEKKPKEALEVLLRYQEAKTDEAPDAEAFLSYTYIELGMYDKAREHADNAYRLGYPCLD